MAFLLICSIWNDANLYICSDKHVSVNVIIILKNRQLHQKPALLHKQKKKSYSPYGYPHGVFTWSQRVDTLLKTGHYLSNQCTDSAFWE